MTKLSQAVLEVAEDPFKNQYLTKAQVESILSALADPRIYKISYFLSPTFQKELRLREINEYKNGVILVLVYANPKYRVAISRSSKGTDKYNLVASKPVTIGDPAGWQSISPVLGNGKSVRQIVGIVDKVLTAKGADSKPNPVVKQNAVTAPAPVAAKPAVKQPTSSGRIRVRNGYINIGDYVSFKSDIEQSGKVIAASPDGEILTIENVNEFDGDYIGGQTRTKQYAGDCWIDQGNMENAKMTKLFDAVAKATGKKTSEIAADPLKDAVPNLEKLTDAKLNNLVVKAGKWFDYDKEDVQTAMKAAKQEKIDFIMAGDPLYAEGGLADFLMENGIVKKMERAALEAAAKKKKRVPTTKIVKKISAIALAMGLEAKDWMVISDRVFKEAFGKKAKISIASFSEGMDKLEALLMQVDFEKLVQVARKSQPILELNKAALEKAIKSGKTKTLVTFLLMNAEPMDNMDDGFLGILVKEKVLPYKVADQIDAIMHEF